MVKHTQIMSRLLPTNCLSVFDNFVELGALSVNNPNIHANYSLTNNPTPTGSQIVFQSIAYGEIWEIFIGINDIIKTKNLPSKNAYKAVYLL